MSKTLLRFLVALGVSVGLSLHGDEAGDARTILSATGLQGGLVVHVGCGDGRLTSLLRGDSNCLVQGLDRDPAAVSRARDYIRSRQLYGPVSVEVWDQTFLPYADNLVNLLVVEQPAAVSEAECLRVLVPQGVAYVRDGAGWRRLVKPPQEGVDEWTHYLHDASGNPVANDSLVGPPRYLQWSAPPTHTRAHEYTPGIWSLVSTGGRIFFVQDKAPIGSMAALPEWTLVARDAHNGLLLWERPLESWFSHLIGWTQSPMQLQRRLVAVGDRLYVPLAYHGPVSLLDAANGELVKTFAETEGADEVLVADGVLVVAIRGVTDERLAEEKKLADMARRRGSPLEDRDSSTPFVQGFRKAENQAPRSVVALDPATGQVLWRRGGEDTTGLRPMNLSISAGRVLYHTGSGLHCADLKTGQELWTKKCLPIRSVSPAGTVAWSKDNVEMRSIEDGSVLWTQTPVLEQIRDVFILEDSVWIGGFRPYSTGNKKHTGPVWGPYFAVQRDLKTGAVLKEIAEENPGHHHRCYSSKATSQYILGGRRGTEFLDLDSGDVYWHSWARGVCRYGVMPANGTLYVPSHSCACYLTARVTGFNAMVATRSPMPPVSSRLAKGPAFAEPPAPINGDDWPTYRSDPTRSGRAATAVPTELKTKWQADLGAAITAPTVAGGHVFVACPDEHRLQSLDRVSGELAWSFTADGRIDSPPTLHEGRALFGSHDGQVYSVRAADGELAWRFRAAKDPRQIASYGQVESPWPVSGSVLVQGDMLCFAAGRSSFLDGGIALLRLNPRTGDMLGETPLYSPDPETGQQPKQYNANQMPGARSDILVADDSHLYLRDLTFTKDGAETEEKTAHLFTLTDFLDASWPHRSYWIHGTQSSISSGCSGQSRTLTYGRLLVFDDTHVYGYGRGKVHWSNQFQDGPYRLFGRKMGEPTVAWEAQPEIHIRAMVLAGDTIFAAGPVLEHPDEPTRVKGAALMAFSATDGKQLARLDLPAPPVFDGLAAAGGELFLTLEGGRVMCFAGR